MSLEVSHYANAPGVELQAQSSGTSRTSAIADLALMLGMLGFFSPLIWLSICLVNRWDVFSLRGITGYLISVGLPVPLTILSGLVALRQIRQSDVPLAGYGKSRGAMALGFVSPFFWLFVYWLVAA